MQVHQLFRVNPINANARLIIRLLISSSHNWAICACVFSLFFIANSLNFFQSVILFWLVNGLFDLAHTAPVSSFLFNHRLIVSLLMLKISLRLFFAHPSLLLQCFLPEVLTIWFWHLFWYCFPLLFYVLTLLAFTISLLCHSPESIIPNPCCISFYQKSPRLSYRSLNKASKLFDIRLVAIAFDF